VDKFMGEVGDKLKAKKISMVVTDEARDYLSEKGYDPAYGARPMRRLVQNEVKKPMSELILFKKPEKGSTVEVGFSKSDGTLTMKVNKPVKTKKLKKKSQRDMDKVSKKKTKIAG
ncbi:hypothetical protein N9W79_02000, partial [bacterium]|nr:hypothetical protein [bacterium]